MKINKKMYINELPKNSISLIESELSKVGFNTRQIKVALHYRICDLTETLPNIYTILGIK